MFMWMIQNEYFLAFFLQKMNTYIQVEDIFCTCKIRWNTKFLGAFSFIENDLPLSSSFGSWEGQFWKRNQKAEFSDFLSGGCKCSSERGFPAKALSEHRFMSSIAVKGLYKQWWGISHKHLFSLANEVFLVRR